MRKAIILCAVAISCLFTSCSISREATSNQNQIQTSVVLSQDNFRVIGNVSGTSKQNYVLIGIGGLSKKSLRESAMSEMLKKAELKGGARAIINTNIQYKNQFYLLWGKQKAIATGTVIEFTK